MCLTLPISARDTRYPSAVRIQEQPRICFPRFSWIWDWRREATAGSPAVSGEESKVDWCRRSAACYLVSFAISSYILGYWWPVLWWKVLLCSEQCSASIATGDSVLWDGEGRKRSLIAPSFMFQVNILQYPSSRSLPNSTIWWLRSTTSIKTTMSIVKMRRIKWKRSLENHYMGMPFHHAQMSASKASAG